ncbi:MAG: SiaB family protein kinase [Campylobacterales bacterium]
MKMDELCQLKVLSENNGIMFFYHGYFTQKILQGIGDALKAKMSRDDVENTKAKKIFGIFVEQVQNIIRYSTDRIDDGSDSCQDEISSGIVLVGKEGDRFFTICGNLVRKEDVERLSQNLESIRLMEKDELKKLYKEKIRSESDEHSKGAGIGFIEIARKSSEPFEYGFKDSDGCDSFFFLKAFV